ncbi:MAG: Coenzyme F420 hydrogenase/dehydrogenase, beta subunit C-terminal domain [Candidatus Bathyarchaeota archaeon]|nr:Coenzyme F420 hydrogenase/dehydrogenase, beta subunit C-terminal domain [Candidatus Bathyarchaeota archaeon]
MSSIVGFPRLMIEVIKNDKCTLCGTCEAICPNRVVKINEKPALKGACLLCDVCYAFCPIVDDAAEEAKYKLLNPIFKNESIGGYMNIYSARSKLKKVLNVAQDGGIVTSFLISLIENKVIDGALITTVDEEWRPKPTIATSKEEVLNGSGTSYAVSSNLKVLHEAVVERRLKKLAVVGTPCQINAMRKLQLFPSVSGLGSEIYLTIGLFCTESFDYDILRQYLERNDVDIRNVKKFDITRGKFLVNGKDGENLMDVPIKEMKSLARGSCHYCKDYTAEYADISVGSVGSPDGRSTVIIRSKRGSRAFKRLNKERNIECIPMEKVKPGIDLIIKLSHRKKESARL